MQKMKYYDSKIPQTATRVFSGIAHDVYHWQQKMFDGSYCTFEMLKREDAATVVAIKHDKIVLLREEQPGREPFWATPQGHLEPHETSPHQAAARELLEETGMTFRSLKLVRVDFIGNARLEWYAYRFVATDFVSQVVPEPDAGERFEMHEVTFEEAQEHARHSIYASPSVLLSVGSLKELRALPEVKPIN